MTGSHPSFSPLAEIRTATGLMLDALDAAPTAAVPSCPGWDVTALAGHLSQVQHWVTAIVAGQLTDRPAPGTTGRAPTDPAELRPWMVSGLDELIAILESAGHDRPAWNFAGAPPTSAFWWRRMVNEAWVHATDAAAAMPADHQLSARKIPSEVAIETVNEFLDLMPVRKLAAAPNASIGGSLHLHATDAHGEWMITLEGGTLTVEHGHGKGAAAVRGTAHDLALFVWARSSAINNPRYEIFGDETVVANWQAIGAF
jgi:uncharacterized protein (TIGR03083 family)